MREGLDGEGELYRVDRGRVGWRPESIFRNRGRGPTSAVLVPGAMVKAIDESVFWLREG